MLSFADFLFIVLAVLFVSEQIFYLFLGSYPYRYEVVMRAIKVPNANFGYWDSVKKKRKNLAIKTNRERGEVYLKYSHPIGVLWPSLFIGHIQCRDMQNVMRIKVGPVSAIFVVFLFAYALISGTIASDGMYQLVNILCLIAIITFFYLSFWNAVNEAILERKTKP